MRISDWSSDVCSSDLAHVRRCDLVDLIQKDDSVRLGIRQRLARNLVLVEPAVRLFLYQLGECGGHLQAAALGALAHLAQHVAQVDHADLPAAHAGKVERHIGRFFHFDLHLALGQMAIPEPLAERSEEHTSELQSLMRISYAVFCLKKKKK